MTLRTLTASAAAALVLSAQSVFAADGVLIVQRTTSGTSTTTTQLQIEKDRMRAEVGAGPEAQVLIYDGTKQVLYVITPARKSYIEMTKAELEKMAAQMQMMLAQLENLPAAQRDQIKGMMAGRGLSMSPSRIAYKRVGTDKVGKWACEKYDGYRDDQKVNEVCAAAPSALGLGVADFAVTQQLTEFLRTALPQIVDQVAFLGRGEADGYAGFPIRSSMTIVGFTTSVEVAEVSRQTFPDTLFAIPAGFTKQTMMGGRGQ
jgi:hypothetical protein